MNRKSLIVLVLSALLSAVGLADVAAAQDGKLTTRAVLLIGHPSESAGGEGVLIVPGTVIPLPRSTTGKAGLDLEKTEEGRTLEIVKVAESLRRSLRLKDVTVKYQLDLELEVETRRTLPAPTTASDLRIEVELLGYNDHVATYSVQFFDRSAVIADSKVTAVRGQRTIVGGLDGDEAPYLFLVLEPAKGASKHADAIPVEGDVTPPRVVEKTMPQYPEEARKEKIEGMVVLQTVIDSNGEVQEIKASKSQPYGLTEAAIEAVRQWRFEPALLDGEPVAVIYSLTINFRLDPDKKKEEGKE